MVADSPRDPASRPVGLPRFWLHVHQWIGLGLFALLVPLAATGSLSALRPTVEAALHPERRPITPAPAMPSFSAYQAAAIAAFGPGATLTGLTLKPGEAVIATGRIRPSLDENAPGERGPPVRLTAWIDPGAARLLAVERARDRGDGFMAKAHQLHETLMLDRAGRRLIGVLGALMLVQALIGLVLWWPRAGALWFGLRWRRTGDPLTNLHYLIGFWTSVPLAFLALTGIGLSFPQVTVDAIRQVAPVERLRPPGRTLFASRLNADQAAALAMVGEDGARIVSLEEPTDSSPSWKFQVIGGGHPPVRLGVNDDTGAVRAIGEKRSSPGNVMQRAIKRLHDGDGDGRGWAAWRWIAIVAGFMPLLLALTGATVFCARQARRATA
jgi:uncharacterized iron-regulated membrane protein